MKPPQPVSHVLFDMDGLLLDTEIIYTEVTQTIVSRYDKVFDWSIKSNMIGLRAIDSAVYLVSALDLPLSPEDYLHQRDQLLRIAFATARALPGAENLIRHLHHHRIPIGLATSSDFELYQIKAHRHADWFRLFDTVVAGDDPEVKWGKPAPDIFLVAASRLSAPPDSTLVFEDAPSGLQAGLAANMRVVAIPDPHMDTGRYKGADLILNSLEDFNPSYYGLPGYGTG